MRVGRVHVPGPACHDVPWDGLHDSAVGAAMADRRSSSLKTAPGTDGESDLTRSGSWGPIVANNCVAAMREPAEA
jgi:hypothetical protein